MDSYITILLIYSIILIMSASIAIRLWIKNKRKSAVALAVICLLIPSPNFIALEYERIAHPDIYAKALAALAQLNEK